LLSLIQAAGWPIWPLIACSVAAMALVIERFVTLRRSRVVPPQLLQEVLRVTSQGIPAPDVIKQLEQNSALGEVLAGGLRQAQVQPRSTESDLRQAVENAGRAAAHRLERYLSALATIASAAPLLGLLGTVIGMIEIFASQGGGGLDAQAVTSGNPQQLAHGISIALYNTAFGLIVAIPALIFWRFFRSRVDAYVLAMELAGEQLVRHLARLPR
jgi:biopolymer transport protein ExbB